MIQKVWKKITAIVLMISFTTLEIGWAQPLPAGELLQRILTEKKAEGTAQPSAGHEDALFVPSSLNFLESEGPLEKVNPDLAETPPHSPGDSSETAPEEQSVKNTAIAHKVTQPKELQNDALREPQENVVRYGDRSERSSFAEALEQLRPEFAAAVIVDSLTAEDVYRLTQLPFETAVVVLEGEIILFSTGNEDEIGLTAPVQALLQKASFISHIHTDHGEAGPSEFDLEHAFEAPGVEYVLTEEGAYAYNRGGLLNGGAALSVMDYLKKLDPKRQGASTYEARLVLNEFIREMDAANAIPAAERGVFRRGNTVVETFDTDANGHVWRRVRVTKNASGQTLSYEDLRSDNRWFYEYDDQGQMRAAVIDSYVSGLLSSRVATTYVGGVMHTYQTMGYNADGSLLNWSLTQYREGAALKQSYHAETYAGDGQITINVDQIYDDQGKIVSHEDTRYSQGVPTLRMAYEYDSKEHIAFYQQSTFFPEGALASMNSMGYRDGVVTFFRTEDYFLDGTLKALLLKTYLGSTGHQQTYHLENYDNSGRILRRVDQTFEGQGKIITHEDLRFVNDVLNSRFYYEYDSSGRMTLYLTETYSVTGVLNYGAATVYEAGVKTAAWQESYTAEGLPTGKRIWFYDPAGRVRASADYRREQGGLKWLYRSTYDESGERMESRVIEFLSPQKTTQSDYVFSYRMDGRIYDEAKTLAAGHNRIELLGALNIPVEFTVELKVSDFDIQVLQEIPPRTNQNSLTVEYLAGAQKKTQVFHLVEGPNRLILSEADADGFVATAAIDIVLDTTPPRIVLLKQVPAKTADANLEVVYTADQVQKTKSYVLHEGSNTVTFSEKDDLGNEVIKSWEIVLDTTPPAVVMTEAVPALTRSADLTLRYTVDGSAKEKTVHLTEGLNTLEIREQDTMANETVKTWRVTLDSVAPEIEIAAGMPAKTRLSEWTVDYSVDGISKKKTFDLQEGANFLEISAEDAAGNRTVKTLSLERDTTPPVLTLISPIPVRTKNPELSVSYTVDGISRIEHVGLIEGSNTLTLSAADDLGNETVKSFVIVLDTQAPEIIVTGQVAEKTKESQITLHYTADGAARQKTFDLQEGSNSLVLEAEDEVGNQSIKIVDVLRDSIPPEILLTREVPSRTNQPSLTIHSTADGVAHEQSFQLSEGLNTLELKAQDDVGNESTYSVSVVLDTTGPELIVTTPLTARTNHNTRVLNYTVDGVSKEQSFDLSEGPNTLVLSEADDLGNRTTKTFEITLDTRGPVIEWAETPPESAKESFMLRYRVDGTLHEKLWELQGTPGPRMLELTEKDDLGNESHLSAQIQFDPPSYQRTLEDGTVLSYQDRLLRLEILANGDTVTYDALTHIQQYDFADGRQIHYADGQPLPIIELFDGEGSLVESIGVLAIPSLDESSLIHTTLENGLSVYYQDGVPVLMKLVNATRVYNFKTAEDGSITEALLVYPDGRLELIRNGVVLRAQSAEGVVLDYLPDSRTVREITANAIGWYRYEKDQSAQIVQTQMSIGAAESVTYGVDGLLMQLKKGSEDYNYGRYETEEGVQVLLETPVKNDAAARIPVEFIYTPTGELQSILYSDESRAVFEHGRLKQYVDAQGQEADYQVVMKEGLIQKMSIQRGGAEMVYDDQGFLTEIKSDQGTLIRTKKNADASGGALSDDDVVDILLETVGGDKLSDFELDSEGRILKGILETKDGIKQTIENGVLTGYETVDGKLYGIRQTESGASEAYLKEWNFKNGTRVIYGDKTISEILLADGRRLDQIGLNTEKNIRKYTETLADGTQKDFEDGLLRRLRTAEGLELTYNREGELAAIRLPGGEARTVSYRRNEAGEIQEIGVEGLTTQTVFSAAGKLKTLMTGGVRVDMNDGVIESLKTFFGTVSKPAVTADGLVSGKVGYVDGLIQTIQNGQIASELRPDGTRVTYLDGRISSIQLPADSSQGQGTLYTLEYVQDADAVVRDIRIHFNTAMGPADESLIQFILENLNSSLAQDADMISRRVLSRPLQDWARDRSLWGSTFSTGDTLQFTQVLSDDKRGAVYAFGQDYLPSWQGVVTGDSYVNDGLMTHSVRLVVDDNLPAKTAAFEDMNGDGLLDRVYTDSDYASDYWWVQWNTGNGFSEPVKFSGMDRTYNQNGYYAFYANQGALQSYMGRVPFTVTDLRDMDGDGLPDRILKRLDSEAEWLIQWNNGRGFDEPVLWADNLAAAHSWYPYIKYGIQMRGDDREETVQDMIADLVDMDGDGLPDRIVRPLVPNNGQFDHWFFQKNLGRELGFADAVIWEGVDNSFHAEAKTGGSISWYNEDWAGTDTMTDLAVLRDMNGDGRPDRVLTRRQDPQTPDSPLDWYVQLNNGTGFDAAILWDRDVRSTTVLASQRLATAINAITDVWQGRQVYVDLKDVTGDGLPDRVVVDRASESDGYSWYVEINNGTTFLPAVEWTGIDAADLKHAAIVQEDENFRMNPSNGVAGPHDRLPHFVEALVDLQDINGDGIPDRVLTERGQDHWKVQFGTGSGFLPVQEMRVDSLSVRTGAKEVSSYDHVYVSLKASQDIRPSMGVVRVELLSEAAVEPGPLSVTESVKTENIVQTWTLEALSTDWNDLLLPLDEATTMAAQIRLTWVPEPGAPEVTLSVSNTAFVSLRPQASKDWLDRLLTGEDVLAAVYSESTQTLEKLLTQNFNTNTATSSVSRDILSSPQQNPLSSPQQNPLSSPQQNPLSSTMNSCVKLIKKDMYFIYGSCKHSTIESVL